MAILRDESFINNNGSIIDFPDDSDNASFKYKQKITGQTGIKEQKMFK